MPTLSGMRRRGYTSAAIRAFCETIGVTKYDSMTDVALLEHNVRDDLNKHALRRMAVLNPLKVVLTNLDEPITVDAVNNPENPDAGTRAVKLTREIFIEREDFMEEPAPKFHRLAPGKTVRIRYGGFLTCETVEHDPATGEVSALHCRRDPPEAQLKVKGTIHWVSAMHAQSVEIRLYDRLFTVEDPMGDKAVDFKMLLNPESLRVVQGQVEPALLEARPGDRFQFERTGYFCADTRESKPGAPVFNLTVALKDTSNRKTPA
jgi:glutaminyl-tRNA synthetase